MNIQEKQYRLMTETPVKSLIMKLAIPTVITMLVSSIYNMADTFFVSQLGKSASGAVGVVFSMMAVIQAIGFTLGQGAANVISRLLGVKNYDEANNFASTSFFTAVVVGVIFAIVGIIIIEPLMVLLGATPTVLPFAKTYAFYILLGAPVMICSFVMNNILRSEGKSLFAMIGISTGGIINMFLDPLFIFTFKMGIAGAAIATLLSQIISFAILLSVFVTKRSVTRFNLKYIKNFFGTIKETVLTGIPAFCRQGLASLSTIILNNQAAFFGGDAALSAMGIVSKIYMALFSVGIGIAQGYQPVCGFSYGAKLWKRLRESFLFTYTVTTGTMIVFAICTYFGAPYIMPAFIDDPDVIEIGARALRFQSFAIALLPINVMTNMTYQSTGQKLKAVLLACCRNGICLVPAVLILPSIVGLTGVEMSQAAADLMSGLIALPFMFMILKDLKRKISTLEEI